MDDIRSIKNKWNEKKWHDPLKHRAKVKTDDSTPLVTKATPSQLDHTYVRANRIKTLRGIRR